MSLRGLLARQLCTHGSDGIQQSPWRGTWRGCGDISSSLPPHRWWCHRQRPDWRSESRAHPAVSSRAFLFLFFLSFHHLWSRASLYFPEIGMVFSVLNNTGIPLFWLGLQNLREVAQILREGLGFCLCFFFSFHVVALDIWIVKPTGKRCFKTFNR